MTVTLQTVRVNGQGVEADLAYSNGEIKTLRFTRPEIMAAKTGHTKAIREYLRTMHETTCVGNFRACWFCQAWAAREAHVAKEGG